MKKEITPEMFIAQTAGGRPIDYKVESSLIGKWFHSFNKDGLIKWQGQILSKEGDSFLVQLYGWLDGDPTTCKLVPASEMNDWSIYNTSQEMRDTYDKK